MLRVDRPIEGVVPHPKPFLVNVGLPRTGTMSFTIAARAVGLRVLHSWNTPAFHGKRASEHTRDHWWRQHYAAVLSGVPGELDVYDALTDSPFYSRATDLRRAYPNATFCCTTRSASSWVDSMIFGHLGAGGLYLPRLFGLSTPYRNTTDARRNLTRAFHLHARHECAAVNATLLDLRSSSAELWRRLCGAIPPALGAAPRERCAGKREAPWPRTHVEVSKTSPSGPGHGAPRLVAPTPQQHATQHSARSNRSRHAVASPRAMVGGVPLAHSIVDAAW